jgi:hypothetical protein
MIGVPVWLWRRASVSNLPRRSNDNDNERLGVAAGEALQSSRDSPLHNPASEDRCSPSVSAASK